MKQTNGKRVFITGGASGLGKAIAIKYAKEGYKVCIADLNDGRGQETIDELTRLGCESFYINCDVTQLDALESAKAQLVSRWGGVDIVVNNAGVAGTAGAIEDVELKDWEWVININLLGVARGCKAFTPLFKQQGNGYFVNIASAAGLINPPRMSSYNATKAAVVSLSETLNFELKKNNIGVSVICPAFFKTNLTESMKSTVEGVTQHIDKVMAKSSITSDDIAADIFDAVKTNKFMVISHKPERKMWFLKNHFRFLFNRILLKRLSSLIN